MNGIGLDAGRRSESEEKGALDVTHDTASPSSSFSCPARQLPHSRLISDSRSLKSKQERDETRQTGTCLGEVRRKREDWPNAEPA